MVRLRAALQLAENCLREAAGGTIGRAEGPLAGIQGQNRHKVNYYTIKRHIELAVEKGLVERTGTRPTKLKLTKKGIDYVFLFERLSELIR